MTNVLEMRHRFQADLCGWLEQESKHPTLHSKIFQLGMLSIGDHDSSPTSLLESLALTLDYYNGSTEALETLHSTVFHAIQKNKDYQTDFDAPSFRVGIDHRLLHHVSERFDLHKYTCLELWKMSTADALDFIYITFKQTMKPLRYFHKMVIKLLQRDDRPMDEHTWKFEWWLSFQFQIDNKDSYVIDHFAYLLEVFHDCMYENQTIAKRNPSLKWKMKSSTKKLFSALRDIFITLLETDTLYYNQGLTIESIALLRMIFTIAEKDSGSLPAELRGFIDDSLPTEIGYAFPIKTCQDTREKQNSLEYDWNKLLHENDDESLSSHEKTFMIICSHLQHKTLAFVESGQDQFGRLAFDRLGELIQTKMAKQIYVPKSGYVDYIKCKLWCCYTIKNRASYWVSVLKVIIQFADLWISDILESKCVEIFAALIVQESMIPVLYSHILKHVQQYYSSKDKAVFINIQNLCFLFEKTIECVTAIEELVKIRDFVFIERDPNEDIRSPIFQSITIWNIPFEQEIIKVSNQFISIDDKEQDDEVPEDVVQKLTWLSIIWPYEVVRRLVLSCFQNKNQYKAIVPIMKKLGNLCILKKTSSCQDSLLLLAFKDIIYSMNADTIEACKDNIVHFVKACCYLEFHQEYPLILSPNLLTEYSPALLNFKEVLNSFILYNLQLFSSLYDKLKSKPINETQEYRETHLLRLSLYMLNAFCEFPSSKSKKMDWSFNTINIAYSNMSDLPAVLYVSPQEFSHHLTIILSLRNQNSMHFDASGLRLQDWELAINYLGPFKIIIQYGIALQPTNFVNMLQFFNMLLNHYDWKSQLLWYDLTRAMTQQPVKIPYALSRITGELGGLFVGDKQGEVLGSDDKKQFNGWCDLFEACKLSETIRNILFERASQWEYNLILLWKHPYEGEIIQTCFRRVLHPSSSFSVSVEYNRLLQYFLGQLYDTFACHQVIRNYEKYGPQEEIIPIIHRLSKKGTKLYFTVLYTAQLLEYQSGCPSQVKNTKHDNYYVSSLLKVLQNLTQWGNISKSGQIRSYNELRKILRSSNTLNADDSESFESNLQEYPLEDNSILAPSTSELDMSAKTEPEVIYYPLLNTEETISDRALSILTLFHLCSLSVQFKDRDETQRDATTRLVLQITEGLIDTDSRQHFQRMIQQQPKSRIINWKKKSKTNGGKVMKMRPTITREEEDLLRPVIISMHNADEILQALSLTQSHNNNSNQALYFI